ncbi:MAG: AtpZ/AtpI family protein, partial [Bacteroidales bacterium]
MQDQTTPEEQKNPQKNDKFEGLQNYAKYTGLAFQMIAIILITVWAGTKLDKLFLLETPVFTIILSLLGVAAAIY